MFAYRDRAGRGACGPGIVAAVFAASLVFSLPEAKAQGTGTGSPAATATAPDIQAANNTLTAERLLAQFYSVNSGKAYLTGVSAVTTAPGTVPPGISNPASGANQPGSGNGTLLTATLSGGGESPAVSTSASGSASFLLSQDQTTLFYQVSVTGLSGPAMEVRIRQGPSGQPNGIILYLLSGSSGSVGVRPEDVSKLLGGQTFLEVTTALYPAGEIRGQITMASGTPPVVTPPVVTPSPGVAAPPGVNQVVLQSMVSEIQSGHNAHVTQLEQMLGANAAAAPVFQNLDAPTLTQFLTLAQNLEDFAVGVAQNGTASVLAAAAPGAAPLPVNQPLIDAVTAIVADDGRYAGGVRAFEKFSSTALGGNPNITLSQNGQPFNVPLSQAQMNAFLQTYLAAAGTTPAPATGTTTPAPATGTGTGGGAY